MLNGKCFPPKMRNMVRMMALSTSLNRLEVLAIATRKDKRNKRYSDWKGKIKGLHLHVTYMQIILLNMLKKTSLEINEFSIDAENEINTPKLYFYMLATIQLEIEIKKIITFTIA